MTLFLQGLMYGSSEIREGAASGIGDLIFFTDAAQLRPFIMLITGPLIRIVGDKFSWQVKAVILDDLGLLLKKAGALLKTFLPQLQRSFVKALTEESAVVRKKAALCIGDLIVVQPQVETLVKELEKIIREQSSDNLDALLSALWQVLDKAGKSLSPASMETIQKTIMASTLCNNENTEIRTNACLCRAALICSAPSKDQRRQLLQEVYWGCFVV